MECVESMRDISDNSSELMESRQTVNQPINCAAECQCVNSSTDSLANTGSQYLHSRPINISSALKYVQAQQDLQ